MDEQVRLTIGKALEDIVSFSEEIGVVVLDQNLFISRIEVSDPEAQPVKVNGLYQLPETESYTVIDCTRKMRQNYTWEGFASDSVAVFNRFKGIPDKVWNKYRC